MSIIKENKAVQKGCNGSRLIALLLFCYFAILPISGQTTEGYSIDNQLDINNAAYEDILRLPVSPAIAERLYERIQYSGPFTSIFQLRDVEGISQRVLLRIKPMIRIEPYAALTERESRIENLYFKLDQWSGREGTNQALVDSWIEQALEPVNVNQMSFGELLNLQGVSPVDAAAIINYRNEVGKISSSRDMRSIPYLSYFGYRNARDFLTYSENEKKREFHGSIRFRSTNTPFFSEEAEAGEDLDLPAGQANDYPDYYTRFAATIGTDIRIGYSFWHALEEPVLTYDVAGLEIPKAKWYIGLEKKKWGALRLEKVYVGNYSLAFGEGVVMENTDFFTPRKTGFGFRKRFLGLSGDNSRTRQYKLTGAAAQFGLGNAHLYLFGSFDERDAILGREPVLIGAEGEEESVNPVSHFIVLDQRFEYAPDDSARIIADLPWRDSVKELTYGFHTAYDILPTTQLGFTYYESAYDRPLRPPTTREESADIVLPAETRQIDFPDNEIFNSYGGRVSDGENPFWSDAKSFRRVYGLNFRSVYQNVSFQAEYGELDTGDGLALFSTDKNPWALSASAYVQYNNLYLMGLYRNYQLGYDNPYQRSFSNYRRFKRSVYEDYFYLQSGLYGQLYSNNPQPQAEEGFYFLTRYQINRKTTLTVEYDNWIRQADDVPQYRLRGTLQFRPIFPIDISLRQKYQGREVANNQSIEYFENLEFRGRIRLRLSRFNSLSLDYGNNAVKFRPRPRLFFGTEPGSETGQDNLAGNAAIDGEFVGGNYTHNFNEWMKVTGGLLYYRGFYWTFEDTQFLVLDSDRGAMRYWMSFYSRINNQLSMRLKYARDRQAVGTFVQTRETNNDPVVEPGVATAADYIQGKQDVFYLELNYNF